VESLAEACQLWHNGCSSQLYWLQLSFGHFVSLNFDNGEKKICSSCAESIFEDAFRLYEQLRLPLEQEVHLSDFQVAFSE